MNIIKKFGGKQKFLSSTKYYKILYFKYYVDFYTLKFLKMHEHP